MNIIIVLFFFFWFLFYSFYYYQIRQILFLARNLHHHCRYVYSKFIGPNIGTKKKKNSISDIPISSISADIRYRLTPLVLSPRAITGHLVKSIFPPSRNCQFRGMETGGFFYTFRGFDSQCRVVGRGRSKKIKNIYSLPWHERGPRNRPPTGFANRLGTVGRQPDSRRANDVTGIIVR